MIGNKMTYATRECTRSLPRADGGPFERLLEALRQWTSQQVLHARIRRERQQLRAMSDTMLKDLGITRGDALAEARRRDVPASRQSHRGC